jgi:hypothetical protein
VAGDEVLVWPEAIADASIDLEANTKRALFAMMRILARSAAYTEVVDIGRAVCF